MEKRCETCFNYLGGIYACCRLNLEKECREGEFEAWKPKHRKGETNHEARTDADPVQARD